MVCSPFQGGNGSTDSGLVGDLYYLLRNSNGSVPSYSGLTDFLDLSLGKSKKINATFYFANLGVTPRLFSAGFATGSGDLLKTEDGTVLTEYFALSLKSILHLTSADPNTKYQFAVLSDDGANVYLDYLSTGSALAIGNDGDHNARIACTNRAYTLDQTMNIPIQIDYYQGPRYHIALTLLWREVTGTSASLSDPACGLAPSSNQYYYDTTVDPPAPTTAWTQFLDRGWKIIPNENFTLPDRKPNPCASPTPVP